MGLNLDLDHVAFSAYQKFDGRSTRMLTSAEIAQIAGRAGRHLTDGSFGTTGGVESFDSSLVQAVEDHRFPPVRRAYWRNAALSFETLPALLDSLAAPPPLPGLQRTHRCGRPPYAAHARPRPGDRRDTDRCRSRRAPLGGLPNPRFPQDHDGGSRRARAPDLPLPGRERPIASGVGRSLDRAVGAHRGRHRYTDSPHQPCSNLDLRVPSHRLGGRCARLAGAHPGARGRALRRAPHTADPALRQSQGATAP